MSIDRDLWADIATAYRLALRAAYHACDHPPQTVARTARRGCGACRAVVALQAVLPRIAAARREFTVPPAQAGGQGRLPSTAAAPGGC